MCPESKRHRKNYDWLINLLFFHKNFLVISRKNFSPCFSNILMNHMSCEIIYCLCNNFDAYKEKEKSLIVKILCIIEGGREKFSWLLHSPLLVDLGRETDDREGREIKERREIAQYFPFNSAKWSICTRKIRGVCENKIKFFLIFGFELLQLIMKYCLFIKA